MKLVIYIIFLISFPLTLLSQDTTQYKNKLPIFKDVPIKIKVSASATAKDLFSVYRGIGSNYNRQEAIDAIAEKSDTVLLQLGEFLFMEKFTSFNIKTPQNGESIEVFAPQMVMAVNTLEQIGTPTAYSLIVKVAASHKSPYVRSFALNALSNSLYMNVKKQKIAPRTDVLDILTQTSDDNTFIGEHQKTMKQIANEGLLTWLGCTFDDPKFDQEKDIAKKANSYTNTTDFGKNWLKTNVSKLTWNNQTGHFEVKK